MSTPSLTPGSILRGRYEIRAVLGRSRVATTWLAVDRETATECVVKELSVSEVVRTSTGAESFSGDFTKLVELFEREARVLSHLDHPGVPALVDHFVVDDEAGPRLYTVQERVEGRTLAELVESGRHFTEAEVVRLGLEVARILAHLHAVQPPIIHRDIKPSNVMLAGPRTVHLIDFGAVKTTLEVDGLGGQTVVGTFGYMPPEQYEGRASAASDVYALGGTLAFLLTHRAPGDLPREDGKPALRGKVDVSPELATVLERMLELRPEDRYRDGAELLADLERVAAGRRPVRHRASPAALVAVGAVVLAAGAVVSSRLDSGAAEPASGPGASSPPGVPAGLVPVRAEEGVLALDLFSDFRYVAQGFPMGRAPGQTGIPLGMEPRETLRLPPPLLGAAVRYGAFPLGNGPDREVALVLARRGGTWELHVDRNNDEDLTNDGPPRFTEGSGPLLATQVEVQIEVVPEGGRPETRPYKLWVWFHRTTSGEIQGRFYALHHYAGTVEVDGEVYAAVAFEQSGHDGLYRESGLCIDLDRDGECAEGLELFHDGETVPFPGGPIRLALRYP